jgi:hypothetical protein
MLSIAQNMRACARVLHATLDTLSPDTQRTGEKDACGPSASAVRYDAVMRSAKDEKKTAWCHACALDAGDGLWTLASTIEGGDWVLMAMKGTLSQQSNLLERMCFYRMKLPPTLFDGCPQHIHLKQQLVPKLQGDSLSLQERVEKIRVRVR